LNIPEFVVEKEFQGTAVCGLYTVYDISGDCPKVVEFRVKPYCTSNYMPPEKWKAYSPEQRAKWRVTSNPLRKNWKVSPKPACLE
jgi:hypothetical protein